MSVKKIVRLSALDALNIHQISHFKCQIRQIDLKRACDPLVELLFPCSNSILFFLHGKLPYTFASHRSCVAILLPSVVRLRYFCHRVRKFSEIVKIESSLRGGDLSRKGLALETRALAFPRDSITINECGRHVRCGLYARLAQCARVRRQRPQ